MQNRPSATMRLIELAERLTPSGEIGDGMVQQFHEAAALARLEQGPRQSEPHVYCAPCFQSATAPRFVGCSKPGCPLA